eukprot:c35314_g1_i1 orf=453-794(+)
MQKFQEFSFSGNLCKWFLKPTSFFCMKRLVYLCGSSDEEGNECKICFCNSMGKQDKSIVVGFFLHNFVCLLEEPKAKCIEFFTFLDGMVHFLSSTIGEQYQGSIIAYMTSIQR